MNMCTRAVPRYGAYVEEDLAVKAVPCVLGSQFLALPQGTELIIKSLMLLLLWPLLLQ